LKEWDHAEFAYNRIAVRATCCSPFETLYRINPMTPIDLIPLPTNCKVSFEAEKRAKETKRLHEQIRAHIEKVNEAYKAKATRTRNA